MALVGDDGAGKSTLVKVLAGVFQPSAGTIRFMGEERPIPSPAAALDMGIPTLVQDIALRGSPDVVANIFLGRERGTWALDGVGMELRAWTIPNELAARVPSSREPFVLLVNVMAYVFARIQWGRSRFAVGADREARRHQRAPHAPVGRRALLHRRRRRLPCGGTARLVVAASGVEGRLAPRRRGGDRGHLALERTRLGPLGVPGCHRHPAICSGLTLLNLSSFLRCMIHGGVLARAVVVDSLARLARTVTPWRTI